MRADARTVVEEAGMSRLSGLLRRPAVIAVLVVAVVAAGVGAVWFQPWKLFVDETVNEALPEPDAVGTATAAADPTDPPESQPSDRDSAAPSGPRTLASGELLSHEHPTSGTVRVVRLADGSRVLRLENLDTSNGPDLRVWITDAPVKPGRAGWRVFDDGAYLSLGKLKGNKGNQNYPLPADADLDQYTSVSIWCDRFDVSFGAAALSRA